MGGSRNEKKRSRSDSEGTKPITADDGLKTAPAPASKRARVDERRSIFVRSLPSDATNETLADFFSQHFPVKHAVVVSDQQTKESRGYGFVTFADVQDAAEAKKSLDKKEWNGKRIRVEVAEPRHRSAANGAGAVPPGKPTKEAFEKPPKLIVRNLPWSIKTSDQLSHLFRSFGKVKFADLPQSKGKLKGFGFVTIRGKQNAEKALEAINGKEIDGRTLAVDWAVDKETWDQQHPVKENNEEERVDEEGEEEEEEEEAEDQTSASDTDEDGGAPVEKKKSTKQRDEGLDADLQNFLKNHMQNLEDEDESDEDNEEDVKPPVKSGPANNAPKRTTDNSSTIFIRNLPFTTTDEQLKAFFDHFGKVRYARVVIDKITEKPAGTAFVCFFNQADAKTCVKEAPRPNPSTATSKHSILQDENADPSGKYTLEGRLLQVAQAVNKEEASNLADNALGKRREKDKRRLYLLPEGAIGSGSPLFNQLSPSEIQMRQQSATQRKKLVQSNPSLHISLTRLALRNIPRNFESKDLKELARKAVVGFAIDVKEGRRQPLSKEENARDGTDSREKEQQRKLKGKGIIRQAKIVFESNQGSKINETAGAGKSRGYGFVEYTSHHWALMGLRYLNGQQVTDDNGKKQRLIAEFAIENAQVVQRRRAAEEKAGQQVREQAAAKAAAAEAHDSDAANKNRPALAVGKSTKGRQGGDPEDGSAQSMQHKLIARTRLMRKKKAQARGKK